MNIPAIKTKLFNGKTKLLKQERKLKQNKAGKVVVIGFYTALAGVTFLSFQSYSRTGFLNEKINGFQHEARAQMQSLNSAGFVASPAGEDYSRKFIKTYIDIPADKKGRDERATKLLNYFAEGLQLEKVENISEFNGKRVIKDIHLYKVSDIKEKSATFVFRISYGITAVTEQKVTVKPKDKKAKPQVKTVQKEQPTVNKETLIAVPLGTDGHSFNVIEQPHFEALPAGKRLAAVTDQEDKGKQNYKKEEELKQFATQFFTSYTENSVEEMAYLMAKPASLKGLYKYKGLDSFIVYNGDTSKEFVIKSLIELEDMQSGLSMKEPITLTVTKQNGKYFVKQIKNTIGG